MSDARIRIVPFSQALFEAYAMFARESFGPASYQAAPRYLQWLYECNPLSRGSTRDMLVARWDDGSIVGCIHTMRLSWTHRGVERVVPSLHNTMMHPAHRGVAGGMLILQAFKGESHAFVPGAEGAVVDALRSMKFTVVPTSWAQRILNPVAGGLAYLTHRLGRAPAVLNLAQGRSDLRGVVYPRSAEDLKGCVALANVGEAETLRLQWTPETFFWRFFHPLGPRHLFVVAGNLINPDGYAIASLGVRKGIRIGRIVDLRARSDEVRSSLLYQIAATVRLYGMHLLVDFNGGSMLPSVPGWKPYASPAQTLFYHRSAADAPADYAIPAAAGDYGFEALLTTT